MALREKKNKRKSWKYDAKLTSVRKRIKRLSKKVDRRIAKGEIKKDGQDRL